MKQKKTNNALILFAFLGMMVSFQSATNAVHAHETWWQEKTMPNRSEHLMHYNRSLQHHHPYQWRNSHEGVHGGVMDIAKLLQNGKDKGIIHRITFVDRAGYLDVSPLFMKLAYRDQLAFANAVDGLLKAQKKDAYNVFYIRLPSDEVIGSYSRHGLDIY